MSEKDLAQKILSWIERTKQEDWQDETSGEWERRMLDRNIVLVDDIEKLCKEYEAKPTGWCIVQDHGPELVYLPPGTQIVPPNHDETLWQIAKDLAKESSLYEIAGHYYCNYCTGKQESVRLHLLIACLDISEDPDNARQRFICDFPHDPTCIVRKARQLMEWRKVHAEK